MIARSNCDTSNGGAAVLSQLDWHQARSDYDHSVTDLLEAMRRCSTLALSDEEKCHLLDAAREHEQAAFFRYKQVLDAA